MSVQIAKVYKILPSKKEVLSINENNYSINIVESPNIGDFTSRKGLKALPYTTQNAIITALKLVEDDKIYNSDRIGVFVGCSMDFIGNTVNFLNDAYKVSARLVSPINFPNTVLNSISGWVSIVLGITGINTTINTGYTSGLDAMKIAYDYINYEIIDRAIVIAVEGISEEVIESDLCMSPVYSEGAVGILMEKNSNRPVCSIESIYSSNILDEDFLEKLKGVIDYDHEIAIYGSGNAIDDKVKNLLNTNEISNVYNTYSQFGQGFSLNTLFKLLHFLNSDNKDKAILIDSNENGNKSFVKLRR